MKASGITVDREEAESLGVYAYRYQQAAHAGLEPDDAMTFAGSDSDVSELRKLVAAGATPEQISAIVL